MLICPLNWGLGHATRDIPIVKRLRDAGCRVIIATEAPLSTIFQESFPEIETYYFSGPKIRYHKSGSLLFKLLLQMPQMFFWLLKERQVTKHLVKKYNPYCIISDNRYGVRHKDVHSIIITHQLMIKLPGLIHWLEKPLHLFVKRLIQAFDECWVPDNPIPDSLAGDLVHKYPLPKNAKLIGPISRFMDDGDNGIVNKEQFPECKNLVVLSGPEPQRGILKNLLISQLSALNDKSSIICGIPDKREDVSEKISCNLVLIPHLNQEKLRHLINKSSTIICRSGYSSIMDLWFLEKNAILIPTPGQTEQEYLAQHNKNRHCHISQKDIPLKLIGNLAKNQIYKRKECHQELLQGAIDTLLLRDDKNQAHH